MFGRLDQLHIATLSWYRRGKYSVTKTQNMLFKKSEITAVDFANLQQGDVANATFTSFNYRGDFVIGTFVADKKSVQAIIGTKADYKISDLMPLKGCEVEITFSGTKVANGVTYPRYYIQW